jgi:predicted RNA-binding Zn-ribbon protein involved in translation (DUF1610 family)
MVGEEKGAAAMNIETGTDLVEFICSRCPARWLREYQVRYCEEPDGEARDYYRWNDLPVLPPYSTEGAVECPQCGTRTTGRLARRRFAQPTPAPPGSAADPWAAPA